MVKGADRLLVSAEKIGIAIGLSPFIIGVTIVGLGTSFPELIIAFIAIFEGITEIVPATAIGSNISNILLVVGASAIIGRRLSVSKDLIDLDLPLLAIGTVILLGIVWDREITFFESLLLVVTYGIYFIYTIFHKHEEGPQELLGVVLPSRRMRKELSSSKTSKESKKPKVSIKDIVFLVIGIVGLAIGSKYLIDSVVKLSEILNIGAGVIAISAVAVGTSLPELLVSVKAALQKKSEVALGNIFGSNIFNMFIVIGLPGLFGTLLVDSKTFAIGVPALAAATLLFVISGISRRIHVWEGAFYLSLYVLFIGKLFDLF